MIKGKKTGLRAIEKSDLKQLMEWRNNPELRKYFRETKEINYANQEKWFESINKRDSNTVMFAIVRLDTNELIGACGLCYIDTVNKSADFSIYIGYEDIYIDNIYAVDAGNLLKEYGFNVLNLHRLWAEIYSIDNPKKAFFKTLDFTLDGTLNETYWYNKKWHDSLFFRLLAQDYLEKAD